MPLNEMSTPVAKLHFRFLPTHLPHLHSLTRSRIHNGEQSHCAIFPKLDAQVHKTSL